MVDVDKLMKWENGELSDEETLKLFAGLIKSGMAWSLQGMYGRTAMEFIEAGYIDRQGNILKKRKPSKKYLLREQFQRALGPDFLVR